MPSACVVHNRRNNDVISQSSVWITVQTIGFDLPTYTAIWRKMLYPLVTGRHPKTLYKHVKSHHLCSRKVFVGTMIEKP